MLFTFTTARSRHGEGNGLHRRCRSMARPRPNEPYRPHMLQSPWHPGWIAVTMLGFIMLVADRPCPSLFHTREQKNGLLESPRPLVEQDGADAVQDGPDARTDGATRLVPASARPPAATAPSTNTAPTRCAGSRKSNRIQGFPRPPASRQGQGRVRPVHGPAPAPSRAAGRKLPSRKAEARFQAHASGHVPP